MKLVNGKKIAAGIKNKIKKEAQGLAFSPSLQVITLGESELTQVFLREKKKACQEVGINFRDHRLPASTKATEITDLIQTLNADPQATGILVQLPLPPGLGPNLVLLDQIDPKKDVDCLTATNFGRFVLEKPTFVPPTVQAVNKILKERKIEVKGKNVVVVGAGRIAGLPIALSLLQQGATVTMCHEFTQNLEEHALKADILISAVGQLGLINGSMIKKGAVVIDVGTSWVKNKIVGDVNLKSSETIASIVTPVPGGVGPITVACLLKNVLQAAKFQS